MPREEPEQIGAERFFYRLTSRPQATKASKATKANNLRREDESQPPALLSLFRVELGSMLSDMYNPYLLNCLRWRHNSFKMPNVSNSLDWVSFRQCPHVPQSPPVSLCFPCFPPVQCFVLSTCLAFPTVLTAFPSGNVLMSQQSPPASVCFPCFPPVQCFAQISTVFEHSLLRANYLGSLQLGSLNSFGNATVLVRTPGRGHPLSFGCFIGFRV